MLILVNNANFKRINPTIQIIDSLIKEDNIKAFFDRSKNISLGIELGTALLEASEEKEIILNTYIVTYIIYRAKIILSKIIKEENILNDYIKYFKMDFLECFE